MKFIIVTVSVLAFAVQAAIETFLTFPNTPTLQGEAVTRFLPSTPQPITVISWRWAASNSVSGLGENTQAGKTAYEAITLTKYLDRATPAILNLLSTGKSIPSAVLYVVSPNDDTPFIKIEFSGLFLTSYQTVVGDGDRMEETITLMAQKYKYTYNYKKVNGASTPVSTCFNIETQVAC